MLNNLKKISLVLLSCLTLTPLSFTTISLPSIEEASARTSYRRIHNRYRNRVNRRGTRHRPRRFRRGAFSYRSRISQTGIASSGVASFYGLNDGYHGRRTASGVIYNKNSNTCAHNGYRFGTRLRVTNVRNGRSTICVVRDTGAFNKLGRVIDLSVAGFRQIAPLSQGLARVRIERLN